jgi:hypothetical protein
VGLLRRAIVVFKLAKMKGEQINTQETIEKKSQTKFSKKMEDKSIE